MNISFVFSQNFVIENPQAVLLEGRDEAHLRGHCLLYITSLRTQGYEVTSRRAVRGDFVQLLAVSKVLLQGDADLRQNIVPTEELGLFDAEQILLTADLQDALEPPNGLDERMLVALAFRFVEARHQGVRFSVWEHLFRVNDDDVPVRTIFHLELEALRLFDLLGGGGCVSVAVRNCRAVGCFHPETFSV